MEETSLIHSANLLAPDLGEVLVRSQHNRVLLSEAQTHSSEAVKAGFARYVSLAAALEALLIK